MSDNSERIKGRLENLQAIEPLVSSMRVLSMSNMQLATNRVEILQQYKKDFITIDSLLKASKKLQSQSSDINKRKMPVEDQRGFRLLVVFGSDRGICGTYNKQLIAKTQEWLDSTSDKTRVIAFGTRLNSLMRFSKISFDDFGSIVHGTKPRYDVASSLIDKWLSDIRDERLTSVDVLSFRKSKRNHHAPVITNFLPEMLEPVYSDERELPWPPPIIEGDPQEMLKSIEIHLLKIRFYELILEAMIAENTIRFRLLEEAKSNTEDLIEELSLEIQIERRQEVTSQIQEIAVSAGLTA